MNIRKCFYVHRGTQLLASTRCTTVQEIIPLRMQHTNDSVGPLLQIPKSSFTESGIIACQCPFKAMTVSGSWHLCELALAGAREHGEKCCAQPSPWLRTRSTDPIHRAVKPALTP